MSLRQNNRSLTSTIFNIVDVIGLHQQGVVQKNNHNRTTITATGGLLLDQRGKMRSVPIFIVGVILVQVSIPKSAFSKLTWADFIAKACIDLLDISSLSNCRIYIMPYKYDCYMEELTENLGFYIEPFLKIRLDEKVPTNGFIGLPTIARGMEYITDYDLTSSVESTFLSSPTLKEMYLSTLEPLMNNLKDDAQKTMNASKVPEFYALPLKKACSALPDRNFLALSVKDVCPTLSRCSRSVHSSSKNACGKDDKCDFEKAIPLMIGVFFYKVSFAFVDRFCTGRCPGKNGCNMELEYKSIVKELDLMKAFVKMLQGNPYEKFFRDAVTRRAYSRIGAAMKHINDSEQEFDLPLASLACKEIEAEPGCQVARFYPHYLLLKKMKKERLNPGHPGDTRDLTLYENVDHAKIIELKKEAIKHTELLSAIGQLNENLETHVRGISSYFKGIARFEEGIGNADVDFLRGKLDDFNTKYGKLQAKVKDDVEKAMIAMTSLLSIQLVEATVALVAKILAESNPIKAIFTGVDAHGVNEAAIKVADSAAQMAHGVSLFAHLKGLATNTIAIGNDLKDNQKQIKSLQNLVDRIKNRTMEELIGYDAETFVERYANYTPKVDRSRMAQNIAMWGAFKESTCNLLNGVEGIGASAGKGVANGFLLCEKLEGTIAEFDALRENIFDFQFELVDSLARVVRGNVAKRLADSIQQQKNDTLFRADQLLAGFLMTQNFMQSQAWLYCDKLEYQNEGRRVHQCSPKNGLFTNSELDNLVAYIDHQNYISIERTVHIPTKPQYSGDLGFINIYTFAREKTASFRLPRNLTWLYKFDWSLIGEPHAPYVENFQLFLPNKEYKSGAEKVKTSTRIVVSTDTESGSYISADPKSSVLYKLPKKQTSYVTVYQEGYRSSTCPKEIPNPYSLCNNLPKICHTSTNVAGDSLLPTTLSRWRVKFSVQSGEQEVEWLAPNATTDLYLIAKVTLRMLPSYSSENRRSEIERPADQQDLCCEGNTYRRSLVKSECEDCPQRSTSRLGGYYCEADSSSGKKRQHVFPYGNPHKQRYSTRGRAFSRAKREQQLKGQPSMRHGHHSNK